jgi:hypothetical protein
MPEGMSPPDVDTAERHTLRWGPRVSFIAAEASILKIKPVLHRF